MTTNATLTEALTLRLPYLPPRELSPNSRLHWSKKQKAKRMVRDDVLIIGGTTAWKGSMPRPLERAVVRFKFGLPDKRRRDPDNLAASCKTHLDALVRIGVLVDDSWQNVRLEHEFVYSKGEPFTEIQILGDS